MSDEVQVYGQIYGIHRVHKCAPCSPNLIIYMGILQKKTASAFDEHNGVHKSLTNRVYIFFEVVMVFVQINIDPSLESVFSVHPLAHTMPNPKTNKCSSSYMIAINEILNL